MLEYARKGLLGLLTPQANTTVEAELSILVPPGVGLLTSRLISKKKSMNERLLEYIDQIEENLENFANAPLKAAIFACTGASYFLEKRHEKDYFQQIEKNCGYPIISATTAISDALDSLSMRRIALISPYGNKLHEKAISYWGGNKFDLVAIKRLEQSNSDFHPIYSLESMVFDSYEKFFEESEAEVIVILGTGLPTLRTLLKSAGQKILISANLCLMWRASLIINNEVPSAENLREWVTGKYWAKRYSQRIAD